MKAALWALLLALLAGAAWLLWGGGQAPREPVRVLPRGDSTQAPVLVPAVPPVLNPSAPQAAASVPAVPLALPAPQPAPARAAAPTPHASDPVAMFRRAIEEASARQAAQGPARPPSGPPPATLLEAIEAARRAQQLPPQPPATPASGAGINPFSR